MVSFISLVIERVDFSSTPFDQKNVSRKERGQIYSSKTLEAVKKYVPSSLTIISLCVRQMQARSKNRQEYQRQIIVN